MLNTAGTIRKSYEHLHRHALYRDHVEGKRVLDIVTGTVHGAYVLAERATSVTVIGADEVERPADRSPIQFLSCDLADLPFDDSHFDVVICDDLMDRTQDQASLIIELKRVLKEDGLFLTAATAPSEAGDVDVPTLRTMLDRHFDHVQLTGLRLGTVSLGFRLDQHRQRTNMPSALTYVGDVRDGVPEVQTEEIWFNAVDAIVALCSLAPLSARATGASLFMPRDAERWRDAMVGSTPDAGAPDRDDALTRRELDAAREQLATLRNTLDRTLEENAQLDARYNQLSIDAASTVTFSRLLARITGTMVATDNDSIVEKLFGLNQLLSTQRSQLDAARGVAETLAASEQATGELRDQLAEAQLRLVNLNAMLDSEQREGGALRGKLDTAQKEAAAQKEQLAQISAHLMEAQGQLGRERGEAEGLRAQVSGLTHILAAQREQLESARAEVQARQTQVVEISGQLAVANALLEQERGKVQSISMRADELSRTLDQTQSAFTQGEEEQRRLRDHVGDIEKALTAHKSELEQQRDAAKHAGLYIEALKEERDQAQAARAKEEEEGRRAREQLEQERQGSARVHGEAVALAEQTETQRAALAVSEQELAKLRQQLVETNAALQQMREATDKARSMASASQALSQTATSSQAAPAAAAAIAGGKTVRVADRQAATARRELERFVQIHGGICQQIADAARDVRPHIVTLPRPIAEVSAIKRWSRKFDRDATLLRTKLFDAHWLATQSPDAVGVRLGRYLRDPALWTLDPHPLFASAYYLQKNPDVAAAQVCPLRHYLEQGWREGRNPHPYFLNDWYLNQNRDVLATLAISPLEHYLEQGWREGRAPNPLFNPQAYLNRYPDVAEAGMEPLSHYIVYGRAEHREIPLTSINPAWTSLLTGADRSIGLLDFMLEKPPLPLPEEPVATEAPATVQKWPPERLNDFWIPQKMRDFLVEGGLESEIDLYTYLCSVMAEYQDKPQAFPDSPHCREIGDRIKALSAARFAALPAQPEASIIIPVYNNVIDTLLCVCSVLEDNAAASYEIIVADDGSSDATPQLIATIGGIVRYLRQPRNYGFVGNCNEAAKQARGRHIVLLNNDTLVMPYWLDRLIDTFDMHDRVGLAGSKLISWDGTLQEAGGIYWKDGSAWNFGRGANARAAEFNYLKDVDYVSGAAIAIPSNVWRDMGGFDEIYAPAYCEDADIAFRLREAGYRTVLNPASEVLHHEGRSHGRDLNSGIKAYQVKNQETFLDRWRSVLTRDHFPNAQNVARARDRSFGKKHVLVIDHYVPQWDRDAGSRSTFMCIKALLKQGYAVTFWPDNLWRDPNYTPVLQQMGVEVIYGGEYRDKFAEFIRSRADLYDAVFANRPHIARHYLRSVRAANSAIKIIYYGHDLHFRRMMTAQSIGEPIANADIHQMRSQELEVCSQADIILYPDQAEVDLVAQELGGSHVYRALPVYAFEQDTFDRSAQMLETIPHKQEGRLLFVGGFNHTPNIDGILWFVQDILPRIRNRIGTIHLTIVGSNAPESVLALESDGIEVAGFVSDERLATLYAETSLVIAPLRYGGGVKGKVVEAMATGVPLATTPIGAQGLRDADSLMFVANEADEFADAVVRGLTDREDAAARARRAWDYTNKHYSMQALESLFHDFIG